MVMPWRSVYSAIHFCFRQSADIFRIGADNIDSLFFDKILEVQRGGRSLSPVRNRDRRTLLYLLKKVLHWGKACLVAGDQVFKPCDVEWFERAGERDRILYRPAWSAVKCEPNFITQHFSSWLGRRR